MVDINDDDIRLFGQNNIIQNLQKMIHKNNLKSGPERQFVKKKVSENNNLQNMLLRRTFAKFSFE